MPVPPPLVGIVNPVNEDDEDEKKKKERLQARVIYVKYVVQVT